jgi:hypothetical protein
MADHEGIAASMVGSALRRSARILFAGLAAIALLPGSVAAAAGPVHAGPFENTYSFVGFACDGFDVHIEGEGTDAFTIWSDDAGNVTKVLYRARYPHDTLTNTVTGRSIVVRGEFEETIEAIPGTDAFTKTITGFRYLVNEPGKGVTVREVGRIVYGDLEQTLVLWQAGKHDLALDAQLGETFCAALD